MRWVAWALLALLMLTAQVTLVPLVQPSRFRPDLVLMTVILISVYEKGIGPLIGAWILGLLVDLHSLERVGLAALTYLALALAVSVLRMILALSGIVLLPLVTFCAALICAWGWESYQAWMYPADTYAYSTEWPSLLTSAAMTGAAALVMSGVFHFLRVREAGRFRRTAAR